MTLQSNFYPIALLALLALPACGVNSSDTCAAYRWGVVNGATELGAAISEDVNSECLVCPDDIAAGEVSVSESARRGALVACLDTEVDAARCAAVAEGVADSVSAASVADTVASCPEVNDADADGVVAVSDCDDADPNSKVVAEDGDCDDTLTGDDCDDANPYSTVVAEDGDCDGLPAESDCDDADPTSTAVADDHDCDGAVLLDDCDDEDATSTTTATDADCDMVRTALDCDDSDPESTTVATDADCDGAVTAVDCDDASSTTYPGAREICEDGVVNNCTGRPAAAVEHCSPMTGHIYLTTADAKFIGEDAYDYAGYSVASAGDVNGDGYADVIVGASGDDDGGTGAGAAYIILGPVTGDVDISTADAKFIGEDENDGAGQSVASAGDVNGDGYDDLLVGSYPGDAYLVLGPVMGDFALSEADAKFIGSSSREYKRSVASAGDVNGDGYDDLIFGNGGGAYLVLGPVTGDVDRSAADAKLSGNNDAVESVASAGDVNGDGYDDVIVGGTDSLYRPGYAYLVLGPITENINLTEADATFIGEYNDDHTGFSVASAGDVNGDGYADLLIGAYGANEGGYYAGAAYLVLGPVTGEVDLSSADAKFIGEDSSDLAGYSVASAGDVNGDGYSDIFIGAPKCHNGTAYTYGAAYLILGPVTGDVDLSAANAMFIGDEDYSGGSVASAGDVNGDGYDDLLVGAYDNDEGGAGAGAAYLILTRSY